jgi:ArsR family transcriptional regulator
MKYLVEQLIEMLKALSDKMRLRIFWVLVRADTELCVTEIIDAIQENQYNVSRHLKILKYSGLIQERKQGRFVFYSLSKAGDKTHKIIIDLISSIDKETLSQDAKRLVKVLSLKKE